MFEFRKPASAAVLVAAMLAGAPVAFGPVLAPVAHAQELSASHIAVAVQVVRNAGATRGFDNVLPTLASQVIDRFIRLRPDLHREISAAVEVVALKLAVRRAELDNDVARIWAANFTEEELGYLLEFYTSSAGKKFSEIGPRVVNESFQAVERWSGRIGEELIEKTRDELRNQGIEFGN
jgi:uncharacterized protein